MKDDLTGLKRFGARAWDVTETLVYLFLLIVFATLCPYLIGFSANSVPEMQPILFLATIGVLAYFSCSVSEKMLLSFGRPPFPISETFRKRSFVAVTLLSVVSFAVVLDVATLFDIINAFQAVAQAIEESGENASLPSMAVSYQGIIFIVIQPFYLALVFWRAKKTGMCRTTFLTIMLVAVFIGYPISAFAGEFVMGTLMLALVAVCLPVFLILLVVLGPTIMDDMAPSGRRYYR